MHFRQLLQKPLHFLYLGEQLFFCLKFRGVHTAPRTPQSHGMFQVQHLVVNDVIDRVLGNPGMVKNAADYDGIVGRIVVSQAVTLVIATPSHLWSGQESVKKTAVEVFKHRLQIVSMSLGRA